VIASPIRRPIGPSGDNTLVPCITNQLPVIHSHIQLDQYLATLVYDAILYFLWKGRSWESLPAVRNLAIILTAIKGSVQLTLQNALEVPNWCLCNIYFAFVHTYILHGIEVYGNTYPSYLDKLTIT